MDTYLKNGGVIEQIYQLVGEHFASTTKQEANTSCYWYEKVCFYCLHARVKVYGTD